jgi:hypothetical protein
VLSLLFLNLLQISMLLLLPSSLLQYIHYSTTSRYDNPILLEVIIVHKIHVFEALWNAFLHSNVCNLKILVYMNFCVLLQYFDVAIYF